MSYKSKDYWDGYNAANRGSGSSKSNEKYKCSGATFTAFGDSEEGYVPFVYGWNKSKSKGLIRFSAFRASEDRLPKDKGGMGGTRRVEYVSKKNGRVWRLYSVKVYSERNLLPIRIWGWCDEARQLLVMKKVNMFATAAGSGVTRKGRHVTGVFASFSKRSR